MGWLGQAVGGVTAVIAAIAISRSEGIRSRKEQRLKGILQDVRLGTLVGDAISAAESVSIDLRFDMTSQIKDATFFRCQRQVVSGFELISVVLQNEISQPLTIIAIEAKAILSGLLAEMDILQTTKLVTQRASAQANIVSLDLRAEVVRNEIGNFNDKAQAELKAFSIKADEIK